MRSLRCSVAVLGLLVGVTPWCHAAYGPKDLLKFRPTQPGVDYDVPADQAAIDACKVEMVTDGQKRTVGYALRDGQGKLLRRFVITNGGKSLNQWSYYQDGFEVYRENDLDGDRSPDECRWLNAGGTRVGAIKGGKIAGWKRISAEEASKVLVQALATRDQALLESLMASPAELAEAGLPKEVVDKVTAGAARRADAVEALLQGLAGWTPKTVWNRFDGTYPHVIPADPATGVREDLVLYENAVVFAGAPAAAGAAAPGAKVSFLQVPEMIKLGDAWKFVELPRAVDPDKPVVASAGGIRAAIFDTAGPGPQRDEAMEKALKALADYDSGNAPLQQGEKKDVARFHYGRIPLLGAIVKVAKEPEDQLNYNKQIVDSLIAAYQTGAYPKARQVLEGMVEGGTRISPYAAYRLIGADFVMRNEEPGSNFMANQKKWMADLEAFLTKFGKSEEAAEVLLQLGSSNEFNAEEDKARQDYTKLVEGYPDTPSGKKAAGALRRLDLVGKPLSIKGTTLKGETLDTAQYQGKPVLVVFWASWGGQSVRRELPDLVKLLEKPQAKGLAIVGVSLDNEKADLEAFLKEQQMTWPQVFEPGGIDSRLATEYGIISLPTMFLIDAQGKVVNRSLRTASEVERQLDKLASQKSSGGVALGAEHGDR
ncbi:Thiol-disulfide oxidoreductase ResA [Aquisphaera giovannonii]|uniref:Thiol-disulfide oxidoreductase ResA n=1 Tax=Aquisphaera giovannonii TaxID=406548 RepID=A0A5B9WA52_9BACT|nr:redoxin domain-containing protein [Aquisphaera giovannonii]QEH37508.1 Thiol-disulfide oxidoreductase ResA [Aquisphaera giovannonii]